MNVKLFGSSSLLTSVLTLLFCFLVTTAHAQDIFYFLRGDTVELYSRQGVFQKSYPLPVYSDVWRSGITTDGIKVWVSYFSERDQLDQIPFSTAPILGGTITKEQIPGGYVSDIAIDGDTLYVTRFLNESSVYSRVESYNIPSRSLTDFFETGYRSFPDGITVTDNSLFVITNGKVSVYSKSGELWRQFDPDLFPGMDPSGICTDGNYLWLFWSDNVGYAYDFNGNRIASEDITFQGLSSYDGVDLAWGPDGPNILTPERSLEFTSVITGESDTLDLVIQNVGNGSLEVTGATLSDDTNFSNTVTVPFTLDAGTSQTFTISFNPTAVGDYNAVLTITSNDPDDPLYTLSLSGSAASGRFYVDCSKSTSGNGSSWGAAFNTIDSAMASAEVLTNAELWVRAGTCGASTVSKQVGIYGGFNGTETYREQRDWQVNETIIDGNSAATAVTATDSATDGVLDGFIIQNGIGAEYGGGVRIEAAGFELVNSIIRNNEATYGGGGVYVDYDAANVSIITSSILDNVANSGSGGGVAGYGTGLQIIDSTIGGNTSTSAGGGIHIYDWSGTAATIDRCRIGGNVSSRQGGGLFASATLYLLNSLIHDNISGEYGSGGLEFSSDNNRIINNTSV